MGKTQKLLGTEKWRRITELYSKAYARFLSYHSFNVSNYLPKDEFEEYKKLLGGIDENK